MEFDLIEYAKDGARTSFSALEEPDGDIMPVMIFVGPSGLGLMPLDKVLESDQSHDIGALYMTATLVVTRATAAVMVATSYIGVCDANDPRLDLENQSVTVPIKDWVESSEELGLMYVDGNKSRLISAPIMRYSDKPPTLGNWIEDGTEELGGRFGNAISIGLRMVREMPEGMAECIDEELRNGHTIESLIQRFVNVALTRYTTN